MFKAHCSKINVQKSMFTVQCSTIINAKVNSMSNSIFNVQSSMFKCLKQSMEVQIKKSWVLSKEWEKKCLRRSMEVKKRIVMKYASWEKKDEYLNKVWKLRKKSWVLSKNIKNCYKVWKLWKKKDGYLNKVWKSRKK